MTGLGALRKILSSCNQDLLVEAEAAGMKRSLQTKYQSDGNPVTDRENQRSIFVDDVLPQGGLAGQNGTKPVPKQPRLGILRLYHEGLQTADYLS